MIFNLVNQPTFNQVDSYLTCSRRETEDSGTTTSVCFFSQPELLFPRGVTQYRGVKCQLLQFHCLSVSINNITGNHKSNKGQRYFFLSPCLYAGGLEGGENEGERVQISELFKPNRAVQYISVSSSISLTESD